MSFVERKIDVEIQLGQGDFGESGFNTVDLSGYRCLVELSRATVPSLSNAVIRIYGMIPSLMNQLSTLGGNPKLTGRLNIITIFAGDDVFGMSKVFEGVITNGWQDYTEMPNTCFVAEASAGMLDSVKPATPTSYPGTTDVATIMQDLAARMTPPLAFENHGVNIKLTTPYLSGVLLDQIRVVAKAANINAEIHNGKLSIWPRNGKRNVSDMFLSPDTGLIGYPSINGVQIFDVEALFNPNLHVGGIVNLQSSLTPACGNWYLGSIESILSSQMPDGPWFSHLDMWSQQYQLSQPAS